MSKFRSVAVAAAMAALASCSNSRPYCGESFCLTEKPASISKTTPAEDFNLYRVNMAGKQFLIYEGNHPNTEGDRSIGVIAASTLPKGFSQGELFGSDRGYQILLRTWKSDWPNYVAVSLATKNPSDLQELVSKLEAK